MNILIPLTIFFCKKWKLLLINLILCIIFAVVYAFFITEKQFVCSTTFLPDSPSQNLSSLTQLGITGLGNTNSEISPNQIAIFFESVTLRKQIIEKFDYYNKYKLEKSPNKLKLAIKAINKDIVLETSERGSLGITEILSFTIKCYHTSPDTAYQITQFIYTYLDSTFKKISSFKAFEQKQFVEGQLVIAKRSLDSMQSALNNFQKQNKAYEIPEQLRMTIGAYGDLKAQHLANEVKISSLSKEMSQNSPELITLRKQNSVLYEKLRSLENNKGSDVLIGFDKYSDLLPQFTNLLRDVETQTKLVAFLTQQYEEAKIKEKKDISSLILVDQPLRPQYKERPSRLLLTAEIILAYFSIFTAFLVLYFIFRNYIKKSIFYSEISRLLHERK